jgi:hypothetical protein
MENTTIGALIGGGCTIVAAVIGNAKGWFKKATDTPVSSGQVAAQTGDISGSVVAVGNNNTQIQGDVHHHHAATPVRTGPFDGKGASGLTLIDILDTVEAVKSPFQQEQLQSTYVGRPVNWPMVFFSMSEPDGAFRLVSFRPRGAGPFQMGHCTIRTDVELKKFHQLKSIRVGDKVWIEGIIHSVTRGSIYLEDDAEITFE